MRPRLPHLVLGSVLQPPGDGRQLEGRGGARDGGPAAPPRLTAELTLDKQLQAIYPGPYGAGEQVCGNDEPAPIKCLGARPDSC